MSSIERGDGHPGFFQESHRAGIGKTPEGGRNLVQTLPQGFSGGDTCNSQGLNEVVVIPAVRYCLEIAFPHCEKPYVTTKDIVKADAACTDGERIPGLGRQGAKPVNTQPHKGESRVRGIEFLLGLRDYEMLHASPPK